MPAIIHHGCVFKVIEPPKNSVILHDNCRETFSKGDTDFIVLRAIESFADKTVTAEGTTFTVIKHESLTVIDRDFVNGLIHVNNIAFVVLNGENVNNERPFPVFKIVNHELARRKAMKSAPLHGGVRRPGCSKDDPIEIFDSDSESEPELGRKRKRSQDVSGNQSD
jgi:hypothetical protein